MHAPGAITRAALTLAVVLGLAACDPEVVFSTDVAQPQDAAVGDATADALDAAVEDAAVGDIGGADAKPEDTAAKPDVPAWPDAALTAPSAAGPTWLPLGTTAIDDGGHSLPLAVTVASSDRYLALRVRPSSPDPTAPWCYGIDDVRLPDGTVWLQPLTGGLGAGTKPFGPQRALPQHGYGVFVLPNDGVSALPDGVITFRVVLRDCRYDVPTKRVPGGSARGRYGALPKSVVVEAAREPAFAPDAKPRLEIRVAISTNSGFPTFELATNPDWNAALAKARAHFATAGVDLQVGRVAQVTGPLVLEYGPGKRASLDQLWTTAMDALTDSAAERSQRFVPVILVRCLLRSSPLGSGPQSYAGQTVRLPGGAPFGDSASGVFVARRSCLGGDVLSGEAFGDVLAHELGHHLGLLHTTTALGQHRAIMGFDDLMKASGNLHSAVGFNAVQKAALRRHFDVHAVSTPLE